MNEIGEILFQRRSDSFDWGLPGGAMEPGETPEETARRELKEETGLDAGALQLLGVFSGPRYYYRYPNGDEVYNVIALYRARPVRGTLQISDSESIDLRFFGKDRLPRLEKRAAALLEECGEQIWKTGFLSCGGLHHFFLLSVSNPWRSHLDFYPSPLRYNACKAHPSSRVPPVRLQIRHRF